LSDSERLVGNDRVFIFGKTWMKGIPRHDRTNGFASPTAKSLCSWDWSHWERTKDFHGGRKAFEAQLIITILIADGQREVDQSTSDNHIIHDNFLPNFILPPRSIRGIRAMYPCSVSPSPEVRGHQGRHFPSRGSAQTFKIPEVARRLSHAVSLLPR